ncbi:MAG TPA: hypothetical protein VHB27_17480 [Rhodopila sp.]|uniref:hypothetical protein n=1 Tax=Rhodopila sp. TaxID=2480087 RepID=UPI002BC06844|nr:hypothetical protein [Rhodopila sp.]HVY17018.1 hypothetical protein [Rhodopila sp.]
MALSGGMIAFAGLTVPSGRLSAETRLQQPPMEVTTDTPEYCRQLADRVRDLVEVAPAKPPREVDDLSAEGQKMCDHGQTRGGILRLRQALLLMMKHDDPPAQH